jgi:hypothetical protein
MPRQRQAYFLPALLILLLALKAHGQTMDMPGRDPPLRETLRNYLHFVRMACQPIDTKGFQGKTLTLRDALQLIMEEMAKEKLDFPVLVDKAAFAEANPGVDICKVPIKLLSSPRKQAAGTILKRVLDQLPKKDGVCLIQYCYVITQKRRVNLENWLSQFLNPDMAALIGAKQKRVE